MSSGHSCSSHSSCSSSFSSASSFSSVHSSSSHSSSYGSSFWSSSSHGSSYNYTPPDINYAALLGVTTHARIEELEQAYRDKLSYYEKQTPSLESAKKMQQITDAYVYLLEKKEEKKEKKKKAEEYRRAQLDKDLHFIDNIVIWTFRTGEGRTYAYRPFEGEDKNGTPFKAGYTAEDGKNYENLAMPGVKNIARCPLCKNKFVHKWDEDLMGQKTARVTCPYCSKPFSVENIISDPDITDKCKVTFKYKWEQREPMDWEWLWTTLKVLGIIGLIVFVLGFFYACSVNVFADGDAKKFNYEFRRLCYEISSDDYGYGTAQTQATQATQAQTIYVVSIGRLCVFDGYNYVDPDTGCEFWYNNTIDTPQWQYWYKDFSEQYGDYGWLEYDDVEKQWYVEVSRGNWQVVQNPPARFWHMNDAFNPDSTYTKPVVTAEEMLNQGG